MEYWFLFFGLTIGLLIAGIVWLNRVGKSQHRSVLQSLQETELKARMSDERRERAECDLAAIRIKLETQQEQLQRLISERSSLETLAENLRRQYEELNAETIQQKTLNQKQQDELIHIQRVLAERHSENQYLKEKIEHQKKEFEDIRYQARAEFEVLANKIFEEKSQKFSHLNKEQMDQLLKPLGENLDQFKRKVEETYDKESKQRFSLEEKVKELIELNNKLSQEANNLTSALKGQAKVQGNWGEVILESILEKSGLQKNREYEVQAALKDEFGNILRPDILIHLPEGRTIVIDSKVTLNAYERYCSAENQEAQARHLADHIAAIYQHIDALSKKNYETLVQSLDFTMMFVPIEFAYLVAIQEDPDLWAYAYAKRILLISPTNLITALKLIADLWKRESQNRNAREIARQGEKLYEKFVGFAESMEDIGKHLNKSQESYHKAMGQLREGRGNLVSQAKKLSKLGLRTEKELPASLANTIAEDEEDVSEV